MRISPTAACAAFFLLLFATAGAEKAGSAGLTDAETERFLSEARIVKLKRLSTGKTRPWRATLSDGRLTHDAQVQAIDVYMPLFQVGDYVEKDFKDSYKFNLAAYRLDRLLGLRMTPVSIYRVVEGRPAAVTWWVDGVWMDERQRRRAGGEPPDEKSWDAYMCNIRVFDQLIANTDRNQENVLITKDWRVWIIDHTRAFRLNREVRDPAQLMCVDPKVLAGLRRLDGAQLRARLAPFLTAAELSALESRRDQIVRAFDRLIAASGRDAVFTPLAHSR